MMAIADHIMMEVAPARERGLKYRLQSQAAAEGRRSREGAWIEIWLSDDFESVEGSRSREGAWIEITPTRWLASWPPSLPRGSVD